MLVEYAVRCRATDISSVASTKALRTTSKRMGSTFSDTIPRKRYLVMWEHDIMDETLT